MRNQSIRLTPWRVVKDEERQVWAVWTRHDPAPGSLNNYVVADGIQDESEARVMAAAPEMLLLLEKLGRGACLDQRRGDRCICFSCEARQLLLSLEGGAS